MSLTALCFTRHNTLNSVVWFGKRRSEFVVISVNNYRLSPSNNDTLTNIARSCQEFIDNELYHEIFLCRDWW